MLFGREVDSTRSQVTLRWSGKSTTSLQQSHVYVQQKQKLWRMQLQWEMWQCHFQDSEEIGCLQQYTQNGFAVAVILNLKPLLCIVYILCMSSWCAFPLLIGQKIFDHGPFLMFKTDILNLIFNSRTMVKRLGLVKLASKLDTKEKTVSFLRENGVLPRSVSCRKCGKTVETTGKCNVQFFSCWPHVRRT